MRITAEENTSVANSPYGSGLGEKRSEGAKNSHSRSGYRHKRQLQRICMVYATYNNRTVMNHKKLVALEHELNHDIKRGIFGLSARQWKNKWY